MFKVIRSNIRIAITSPRIARFSSSLVQSLPMAQAMSDKVQDQRSNVKVFKLDTCDEIKAVRDWRGVWRPQVAMYRNCHIFITSYYCKLCWSSQSVHALRLFRSHVMTNASLHIVYRGVSVIIAKLTYAAGAWWSFDRQRLETVIRCVKTNWSMMCPWRADPNRTSWSRWWRTFGESTRKYVSRSA